MKEFVMLFKMNGAPETPLSPQQMQDSLKLWMDWFAEMGARSIIAESGHRLATEGRLVMPDKIVTNGPFAEIKEFINGYTIIKAGTIDEAAEIAKGCPVLKVGGSVDVRQVVAPEDNS